MSQENVEIVRRGMEDWLRGDMAAVLSTWDPRVVWDTSHFRDWPESNYLGADGVQRFLGEWLETWGDDYELDVEKLLAAPDGRVVSLITHRGTGRQSGVRMELRMAQIVTLREGRITRFDNYDDRAEALKAAGLSEGARKVTGRGRTGTRRPATVDTRSSSSGSCDRRGVGHCVARGPCGTCS